MTVIVEIPKNAEDKQDSDDNNNNNDIIMFTKGADQVMFELEDKRYLNNQEYRSFTEVIKKQIDMFSCKGYRTLCMGVKILDRDQFLDWQQKYN